MKSRITLLAVLGLALFGPALLQGQEVYDEDKPAVERLGDIEDATELLRAAAEVVERMNRDEDARRLLKQVNAVFIVPEYARASFIAGAAGGQGVLISRTEDGWSGLDFYDIGVINLGAAADVNAGAIAVLLLSDDALQGFRNANDFAPNMDTLLRIRDWSKRAQAVAGTGADALVWSDIQGPCGALAISVTDILWADATKAASAGEVRPVAVIIGEISNPMDGSRHRFEFSALEAGDQDAQPVPDEPVITRSGMRESASDRGR